MTRKIGNTITAGPRSLQTICEVHRKMYRMVVAKNPVDPLIPLLCTAFGMAKKMNNKLRQYKHNYDDGWWEIHRLDGGELNDAEPGRQ